MNIVLEEPKLKQLFVVVSDSYQINRYISEGWFVKQFTSQSDVTFALLEKWE